MKKILLLLFISFTFFISSNAQNLITGSTMDSPAPWSEGTCTPEVGLVPEDAYGGPSTTNNVGEVDALSCLQQTVSITPGTVYTISFEGFRRTTCAPDLGPTPGINVKITGVTSNTVYSSVDYHFTGNDDPPGPWPGYTGETQVWSLPGAATDAAVRIEITAIDNPADCGVIIDNFVMVASGILPINISSFSAVSKSTTVDLSWTTGSEINSNYFVVLRSRNGVGFEEAGNVNATGFTTGATYTFNDPHPYSGINYYKLKLVDKSGTYKFSSIIKANLNSKDVNVLVYPTMVSDMLNYVVETPKAAKMTVQVNDISGKKITNTVEFFATGSTQRSIPVSNLASGMYLLTIADESTGFKKSIIFKKN